MFNLIIFTGPYLLAQQMAALGWLGLGFAVFLFLASVVLSASEDGA